jgi:DNA-directed RNA polymerase subunit omega
VVALREIAVKALKADELREDYIKSLQRHAEVDEPEAAQPVEETASEDMLHRQLTEEELLRALTSEAQRRAEPQPEDTGDYEE